MIDWKVFSFPSSYNARDYSQIPMFLEDFRFHVGLELPEALTLKTAPSAYPSLQLMLL